MKRRDLEDLNRQQSQKSRRLKFVLLGIGAIALLSGVFFVGKSFLKSPLEKECEKISEIISNYREFEFRNQPRNKDAEDAEHEKLKTLSIKDPQLNRYYSIFLEVRSLTTSEKREDRELAIIKSIQGISGIQARCAGMSEEELDRRDRAQAEELQKAIERSRK